MLVEEKKQCENSGGLQLEHEAWTLRAPPQILSGDVHGDHLDGGDDGAGGVQDNANLGAGGKGGDDNSCHDNDGLGTDDSFLPRRFDWGECLHKAGDFSSGRQGDQKEELCDDAKLTLLSAAKILSSPVDNHLQVQTQQPYQLRTYAWCWSIPPKCSRYKIQMKTVFKTEVMLLAPLYTSPHPEISIYPYTHSTTVLNPSEAAFFQWQTNDDRFSFHSKVGLNFRLQILIILIYLIDKDACNFSPSLYYLIDQF